MLYHYNDNNNVLLLKMFQILVGRLFEGALIRGGAYSRGRLFLYIHNSLIFETYLFEGE